MYNQRGMENNVMLREVIPNRRSPFIFDLSLRGDDEVGMWEAEGGFLMTQMGPFFWMIKFYNNAVAAGQTDQWQVIVYESTNIQPGYCEGRWFFDGMEYDP